MACLVIERAVILREAADTPSTKTELMYAIETTFTLNWLGIVQVDEKRIRLARVSERGSAALLGEPDQAAVNAARPNCRATS